MEIISFERRKVYDGLLRLIHAWNALSVLFLILTEWLSGLFEDGPGEEALWQVHVYLGYALSAGLVARLVWGFVGPRHARFSDMWHPIAWLAALKKRDLHSTPRFGHDTLASAVYLGVYVLLLAMAATGLGLAAIEQHMGPLSNVLGKDHPLKGLFEEPHEFIYYLLMLFVAVHVAALIWHERKDKAPLAQGMVSGYQYLPRDEA